MVALTCLRLSALRFQKHHSRAEKSYLNIVTNSDLICKGIPASSPPSPSKRTKQVLKRKFCTKTTSKPRKPSLGTEPSSGIRIEAAVRVKGGFPELVELLLLSGIGENLVCGLDLLKLLPRRRVIVLIWMPFLRQRVIRFLDLGGGGGLADSKNTIWILDCSCRYKGTMEGLDVGNELDISGYCGE